MAPKQSDTDRFSRSANRHIHVVIEVVEARYPPQCLDPISEEILLWQLFQSAQNLGHESSTLGSWKVQLSNNFLLERPKLLSWVVFPLQRSC